MPYTLWSQGRLLGESELEYTRCNAAHRGGGFWPTVVGTKLMPIATAVAAAARRLAAKSQAIRQTLDGELPVPVSEFDQRIHQLTDYADYAAAVDQLNALELELRDADGAVVPTDSIDIRDTEFLIDLGRRDLELEEASALADDIDQFNLDDDPNAEPDIAGFTGVETVSDADFIAQMEWDDGPSPRRPFPLYQIHVSLLDPASVP